MKYEADTQAPITKKTCFLKRQWNKLVEVFTPYS